MERCTSRETPAKRSKLLDGRRRADYRLVTPSSRHILRNVGKHKDPTTPITLTMHSIMGVLANRPQRAVLSRLLFRLSEISPESFTLRADILRPIYERLIRVYSPLSNLSVDHMETTSQQFLRCQATQKNHFTAEFVSIVGQCMELGLKDAARTLLKAGLPDIPASTSEFWTRWKDMYTLVTLLITMLQQHRDAELNKADLPFIVAVLRTSVQSLIKRRPQEPQD